jgi:hypothetical protein
MSAEDLGTHLHYNEQVAIETYLLRNYPHLLREEERIAMETGYARWWSDNLDRMNVWGARTRVRPVAPPWEPAPFDPTLAERVEAIVRRLRAEHGDAIRIRRCDGCGKVARGPDDAQCLWCEATDLWNE